MFIKSALASPVATAAVISLNVTTPWWRGWLSNFSDFAAIIAQVAALALAVYKIREAIAARKTPDSAGAAAGAAGSMAGAAAKAHPGVLAAVLAAVGVMALVAMIRPSEAKASPATPPAASVTARGRRRAGNDDGGNDGAADDSGLGNRDVPEWYHKARQDIGTLEVPGRGHNPKIVAYFAKAGFPSVKDDETAWCAAFVNAHLESCGIPGSKSLAARSFERWGQPIDTPRPGCIVVLWRGERNGWQGHVGFWAGESARHVHVLGGNQGDAVSIAKFPKSRVLGYRWPRKPGESRIVRAGTAAATTASAGAGLVSVAPDKEPAKADAVVQVAEQVKGPLEMLGEYWRWAAIACLVITAGLAAYVVYRRLGDHSERGI